MLDKLEERWMCASVRREAVNVHKVTVDIIRFANVQDGEVSVSCKFANMLYCIRCILVVTPNFCLLQILVM